MTDMERLQQMIEELGPEKVLELANLAFSLDQHKQKRDEIARERGIELLEASRILRYDPWRPRKY